MEKSGENDLITRELLIEYGFKENESLILNSYSINISFSKYIFRELSVTIEFGNQYIHLREGLTEEKRGNDEITVLLNGDYIRRKFTFKMIKDLYEALSLKELIKVDAISTQEIDAV